MNWMRGCRAWGLVVLLWLWGSAHAERITVAAAADLKYAMDALVAGFQRQFPADEVAVVYGSSGKFATQIQQGAPFDLYFSADAAFPARLVEQGDAVSPVRLYARGRLVLWSTTLPAQALTLQVLRDPRVKRVAMANPAHAPYGQRAQQALTQAGLWDQVRPKLIYGENIAQAAQFVQTGNAEVGLIALSLVSGPDRQVAGTYRLVDEHLHQRLDQGFVITRTGAGKPLARRFADHVIARPSRAIMASYGFVSPD